MHNTAGCNLSLNLTKDGWESWGKEGGEKVCLWKTVRYLRQPGTAGLTLYVSPGGVVCVDGFILAGWHAHWETEMSSSRERGKKIDRCGEKQKERWINQKEKWVGHHNYATENTVEFYRCKTTHLRATKCNQCSGSEEHWTLGWC